MKATRLLSIILVIMMVLPMVVIPSSAASLPDPVLDTWDGKTVAKGFQYGTGKKDDPYQIRTAAELKYLADSVNNKDYTYKNKFLVLVNDIDLGGNEWVPIGDLPHGDPQVENDLAGSFCGNFDGNGRTVSNFTVTDTDDWWTGFFGNMMYATVKDLHVFANSIGGDTYVGTFAGRTYECTITGCTARSLVIGGDDCVGGFIGQINGDTVTDCVGYALLAVANNDMFGGFASWVAASSNNSAKITNCIAYNILSGGSGAVGGFVGSSGTCTYENCFAVGISPKCTEEDKTNYHAFAGTQKNSTFKNCAHCYPDLSDPKVPQKDSWVPYTDLGMNNPKEWFQGTSVAGGMPYRKGWEKMSFPFVDVAGGTWYTDAVAYCYTNNYASGVTYARFQPDSELTRAQFVQILAKVEGVDLSTVAYKDTFKDVPKGKWFTNAILWAADFGVTGGIGNGLFGPNDKVTREQLASFMRTYAQKKGKNVSKTADITKYADYAQVSGWAREPLAWAVKAGVIGGTSATTLSPKNTATRAQVVVMIKAFCENVLAK